MSSSLELNQAGTKHQSYSLLLKSFGDHQQQPPQQQQPQPDQTQKLEEFLSHLEEEWLKIEAFKRELPLCMQLLSNAMEASRQQLQTFRESEEPKPVLEEFIPLKHSNSEGSDKASNISEKSSWMISAQLWSQSNNEGTKQQTTSKETDHISSGGIINPKLISLDDNKKRNVGAFLPFTKERNSCSNPTLGALPDLALASNDKEIIDEKKCIESENNTRRDHNSSKGNDGGSTGDQGKTIGSQIETQGTSTTTSQAAHRKARRCWSPDLHRRFVNALQMLGGSQVATPKQIRELMKVDGLTNDEVKSHLQKYRLHTRRPSPSPQSAGTPTPQLVVLGSIWVPPEYATAAAAAHSAGGPATIYGAHPASLASTHYCAPPGVPQEFYAAAAPQPPHHHHQLHHHHTLHHPSQHIYKILSKTHSSPESDIRGTGDRSESIEDGKSESNSWKGDSGENGGERRGLASLRDQEGDKNNNGSEITLKF